MAKTNEDTLRGFGGFAKELKRTQKNSKELKRTQKNLKEIAWLFCGYCLRLLY